MDWIRRPYTTPGRVHDSPDAPLVDIVWFLTDLPPLDGECLVNSRDLDPEPWRDRVIGEVPTYSDRRKFNGRWQKPDGFFGQHVCHQDWLSDGEPWPTELPDTIYGEDGTPACCCIAEYEIHANELTNVVNGDAPSICHRWLGIGPVTGWLWLLVVPQQAVAPFAWRVLVRFLPGPTFNGTWYCDPTWNGRGVSPTFVPDPLNPPLLQFNLFVKEVPE